MEKHLKGKTFAVRIENDCSHVNICGSNNECLWLVNYSS